MTSDAPRRGLIHAVVLAALSGLVLSFGYPSSTLGGTTSLWFVAPMAVAGFVVAVWSQGFWRGMLVGVAGGLAFFAELVSWLSLYLGPVPWLALASYMGVVTGVSLALVGWLTRVWANAAPVRRPPVWALAAAVAALWVAREVVTNGWPYGGFPWGRLGLSQEGGPFANLASWVGLTGLGWFVAWLGAAPALAWLAGVRVRVRFVAAAAVLLLVPSWGALDTLFGTHETTTVASVQGNANAGLFSNSERGSILRNHLDAATPLADQDFDFMVWPENASDIDPLRDDSAREQITSFVNRMDRPLLFGTLTERGGEVYNSVLQWEPHRGPVDDYDKRTPVPFAEYMPDREFFHALAPDLVDLVTRDFAFGQQSGAFDVAGVRAGVLICFEISNDQLIRDLVSEGSGIILSPTNNADFGYSVESAQQLAIARMQAIVSGRDLVNISTVGYSAVFDAQGRVLDELPRYTADGMVTELTVREGTTPAISAGRAIEWFLVLLAGATLVGSLSWRGRAPRPRRARGVDARAGARAAR